MGSKRRKDGPTGLLLVNKPVGMTSHDVVSKVRWLAKTRQVGHTGTLDPDATGLLPLTLGFCTRLSQFLILDTKCYEFTMELGSQTTTDDHTGEVVAEAGFDHITREDLEGVLPEFIGSVMQRPPRYSALKVNGRRAYDLARAGEEFELAPRGVEIQSLEVHEFEPGRVKMSMSCGSGTYVRALVRDLGVRLGSVAHTSRIHRTKVGSFGLAQSVKLEDLVEGDVAKYLLSPREMLGQVPQFEVDEDQTKAIRLGQRIEWPEGEILASETAWAVAYDGGGDFVALGYPGEFGDEGQWQFAPKRVRPVLATSLDVE